MPQTILARDEMQLNRLRVECTPLATSDAAARAELREVERRLAIIAQMRALYADLRTLQTGVGPLH